MTPHDRWLDEGLEEEEPKFVEDEPPDPDADPYLNEEYDE